LEPYRLFRYIYHKERLFPELVTPVNILARLRSSHNIYALSFLAMGSLIYSAALPKVCQQCCSSPDYVVQSPQVSSVADESAEREDVVGHYHGDNHIHSHGDHQCNHSGQCECDDRHAEVSGLTANGIEPQGENHQSSDKPHSCVCNSCEQLPLNNQQFCSIISKRKSDFTKNVTPQPRVISIKSSELRMELERTFLRCHSPTPQLNRPTPFSGFGNQMLLC